MFWSHENAVESQVVSHSQSASSMFADWQRASFMSKPVIPYARDLFETRQHPYTILHVVTDMPVRSITPGFSAEHNDEMMLAVNALVGPTRAYARYVIHAPDQL